MGRDAHFFPFFVFLFIFFPHPLPLSSFHCPDAVVGRASVLAGDICEVIVLFLLALSRVHTRCPCKYTATEKRLFFGYVYVCIYICVCVYGGRVKKKGSKTWPCWSISRNRYMEYLSSIYIYSFSYIFTNKIVYLGIWSSFVPRNPLRTNSIAVKLSEITM